jgi:YcxB-like protein
MKTHYQLMQADAEAFAAYLFDESPVIKEQFNTMTRTIALSGGIVAFITVVVLARRLDLLPLAIGFIVGGLFWFVYPKLARGQYIKRVIHIMSDGKDTFPTRNITLELHSDKIQSTSESGEGSLNWSAIKGIANTSEHILLIMESANAIIVPKRAFTDQQTAEQFLALAKEYSSAHQLQTPK